MYALKIVSTDKSLHFIDTSLIINYYYSKSKNSGDDATAGTEN